MFRPLLILPLLVFFALPAYADQLQDGVTAANHGDFQTAVRLLRPLAEQGNPTAQFEIAEAYRFGIGGVEKDGDEAKKWYILSAKQGNETALAVLVDIYIQTKDYPKAIEWLREGAARGERDAQFRLAQYYEDGLGLKQDYAEAAKWFHKAYESGDPIAPGYLGVLYEKGNGVKQSYAEAFKWYWKAAWVGYGPAPRSLGELYENGLGIKQDWVEAYFWYSIGAMLDVQELFTVERNKRTDAASKHLTQEQITDIEKRVKMWKPISPAPPLPQ